MIAAIEAMRDSFDIPSTLPHLSPNDYTEIARRALKEANPTYPVPQIWDSEKIFSVLRRVQSESRCFLEFKFDRTQKTW